MIDREVAGSDSVRLSIAEADTNEAVIRDVLLDEALAQSTVSAGVTALVGAGPAATLPGPPMLSTARSVRELTAVEARPHSPILRSQAADRGRAIAPEPETSDEPRLDQLRDAPKCAD